VGSHAQTDLEALVLQHPLDGGVFSARGQLGLENDTEGAIAHNLALCVRQVLVLSGLAVLDLFTDDFCAAVSSRLSRSAMEDLPPILREEKADGRFWLIVWGYATRGDPASAARTAVDGKSGCSWAGCGRGGEQAWWAAWS
jgi:hypothetical protein